MRRIRELRAERGLTQVRLAVAADMNPATLNRIEQGKANPNIKTLERLAEALGVGLTELLENESPKVQASLWPEEQPERREYDFRAVRDALDGFCNHWSRRLIKGDIARQEFDELGVVVNGWVPVLQAALTAEWNELRAAGKDFDESVVWPAAERFLEIGEDLAALENEKYGDDMEAEKRKESFKVLRGIA